MELSVWEAISFESQSKSYQSDTSDEIPNGLSPDIYFLIGNSRGEKKNPEK